MPIGKGYSSSTYRGWEKFARFIKFNIKREEIIAIGDNFNDMDMIEYAGLGVAMGNAPDYLKDAAQFVTHSNDEDGVRHVLQKFILN